MSERLNSEQVIEIVGRLGPERIVQIIDTGASERELIEAKLLAQQGERPYTAAPGLRIEVMHRLYDILRADLIDPQER